MGRKGPGGLTGIRGPGRVMRPLFLWLSYSKRNGGRMERTSWRHHWGRPTGLWGWVTAGWQDVLGLGGPGAFPCHPSPSLGGAWRCRVLSSPGRAHPVQVQPVWGQAGAQPRAGLGRVHTQLHSWQQAWHSCPGFPEWYQPTVNAGPWEARAAACSLLSRKPVETPVPQGSGLWGWEPGMAPTLLQGLLQA